MKCGDFEILQDKIPLRVCKHIHQDWSLEASKSLLHPIDLIFPYLQPANHAETKITAHLLVVLGRKSST